MHFKRTAILALATASLASCASQGPIATAPGIQLAQLSALPAPDGDGASLVRAQDKIRIGVLGFPELGRELQVDASGNFQFPLIGMINANGQTPSAISQEIASRLSGAYVVNPEVTVDLVEQPGRLFTMGGQVSSPGRYPVLGSLSLLEAVATGGGTTETAEMDEVLVFRTVDGQRYIGVYDLGAIQRGNYEDPQIYPGDIVQVGDSPSLRQIRTILAVFPLVTTPLILFDRVLR